MGLFRQTLTCYYSTAREINDCEVKEREGEKGEERQKSGKKGDTDKEMREKLRCFAAKLNKTKPTN